MGWWLPNQYSQYVEMISKYLRQKLIAKPSTTVATCVANAWNAGFKHVDVVCSSGGSGCTTSSSSSSSSSSTGGDGDEAVVNSLLMAN
jgi:hypothetical protein